jgi:sec-independent protein translocase protein TatC
MDMFAKWVPHLTVLRRHVLRIMLVWLVAAVVVFAVREELLQVLLGPLRATVPGAQVLSTGVTEMFGAYLKMAVWGGFAVSFPYLLIELWLFLKPALYVRERRAVAAGLVVSPLLAVAGGAFGWFVVLPPMLRFFLGFSGHGVEMLPHVSDYVGFVMTTVGMLGLAFNLPLVLVALVGLGWVKVERIRKARRFVVVGIFIVAGIATPPDPMSQTIVAIPLWLLFEVALLAAARVEPCRRGA